MLRVVVVGGIYSPQPSTSRWGRLLSMGTPDSPVRRHVTQPLGFGSSRPLEALYSCGTEQSSATPDRSCSLSGVPLSLPRTVLHCSADRAPLQSTVALDSHCSAGAPDSPVNYSGGRLEKPESGWFELYGPGTLDTVRWHTGQSGAPFLSTLWFLFLLCI
jgi:hypothetical protein